jgi:hypothetical protein
MDSITGDLKVVARLGEVGIESEVQSCAEARPVFGRVPAKPELVSRRAILAILVELCNRSSWRSV